MTSSTRPSERPQSGPTPPDGVIRFSLSGPSRPFDPERQAIRADLADVAEAAHHFAPHYAAPLACTTNRATALLANPGAADPLAMLPSGSGFDVLDVTNGWAWGYIRDSHKVGYVAASDLDRNAGAAA